MRFGGLLYLTSTSGFVSAGHRPEKGLAAYGGYLRTLPYSNEQVGWCWGHSSYILEAAYNMYTDGVYK